MIITDNSGWSKRTGVNLETIAVLMANEGDEGFMCNILASLKISM